MHEMCVKRGQQGQRVGRAGGSPGRVRVHNCHAGWRGDSSSHLLICPVVVTGMGATGPHIQRSHPVHSCGNQGREERGMVAAGRRLGSPATPLHPSPPPPPSPHTRVLPGQRQDGSLFAWPPVINELSSQHQPTSEALQEVRHHDHWAGDTESAPDTTVAGPSSPGAPPQPAPRARTDAEGASPTRASGRPRQKEP